MQYAIEVIDLKKSFNKVKVVKGISFRVKKGQLFAFLGANGAGKTTTIHMLSTLLKPDGGTARIEGFDVVKNDKEVRKRISLTGQYAALDEGLSGGQNLMLIARLQGYSRSQCHSMTDALLHSFGLSDAKDRILANYSGGMRRRLDIAASVVTQPEVIFLDEPTTGLDPHSRIQVWNFIKELLQEGATIVLTTQYLEEAEKLADNIAVIDKGKIIAAGTPDQLKGSIGNKTLTIEFEKYYDKGDISRILNDQIGLHLHETEDSKLIKIPVNETKLANQVVMSFLENNFSIKYYALSEPSLEEVFLNLITSKSGGSGRIAYE